MSGRATELVAPLARLRTDLDRFLPEEAGLLSYHAYWPTHTRLAALHPQLAVRAPSWREYADLAVEEIGRLSPATSPRREANPAAKTRLMSSRAVNAEVARQLAPAFDLFTGGFVA
jgi:hypothetical protein